jgi:Ca2+:H+ antiporter
MPTRRRRNHDLEDASSSVPLLNSHVATPPTSPIHILWTILCSNYLHVLLIFLPLGIVSGAVGWAASLTFVFNFLAIMALASLLGFATEELSKKVGETVGGLLNATLGNATELIVSIIALRQGQIKLVQASMLGSILSTLLLVNRITRLR